MPRYVMLVGEVAKHTPLVLEEELGLVTSLLAQFKAKCDEVNAAIPK